MNTIKRIIKTGHSEVYKKCATCGEEKNAKFFHYPNSSRNFEYDECNVCHNKRDKKKQKEAEEKQKEKRMMEKLEKLKNGEIKKCKKCKLYRKKENFEPGSKICNVCFDFIKKVKTEAAEREKELEAREVRREAFLKEKNLTAEERAEKHRLMIEEFKNKKENK